MKRFQFLRKIAGTSFAFLALVVAQSAASQVCIIFHQEEIPEKLKSFS
jgi:cyclic lactone autoinducer peptide